MTREQTATILRRLADDLRSPHAAATLALTAQQLANLANDITTKGIR